MLSRAEGNPLYAEEYVRMLQDRGFLVRRDGTWRLEREGDLPLPETVHGMIAARLDALSRDEKELVQDAAVIGKVFWPGAVASMGDRSPFALEEPLHALERKEFIRRERRSAVAGETQYAFLHALVRDVAYGQIPRGQRADKHRLAAEWIDSLSSERSEDRAEMLAHHYRQALELARAAGVDDAPLREPARQALIEATERASRLYAIAAIIDFGEAALELAGEDDPARPLLEFRLAEAYQPLGQYRFDLALSARDGFLAHGDVESAALVDILLARMYWLNGNTPASVEHREHALRLVEERPLSFAKARVFAQQARNFAVTGSADRALEFGERALPMAEELRDDLLMSHVLNTLGLARVALGDSEGLELMRRSVELAEASKSPDEIHTSLNNLANSQWRLGDLDGATASLARAREMNERFGSTAGLAWLDIEDMLDDELRGNWDAALSRADAFLEGLGGAKNYLEGPARDIRTVVFTGRGDVAAAEAEARLLLDHAREVTGEQLAPALADAARAFHAAGIVRRPTSCWPSSSATMPTISVRRGCANYRFSSSSSAGRTTTSPLARPPVRPPGSTRAWRPRAESSQRPPTGMRRSARARQRRGRGCSRRRSPPTRHRPGARSSTSPPCARRRSCGDVECIARLVGSERRQAGMGPNASIS